MRTNNDSLNDSADDSSIFRSKFEDESERRESSIMRISKMPEEDASIIYEQRKKDILKLLRKEQSSISKSKENISKPQKEPRSFSLGNSERFSGRVSSTNRMSSTKKNKKSEVSTNISVNHKNKEFQDSYNFSFSNLQAENSVNSRFSLRDKVTENMERNRCKGRSANKRKGSIKKPICIKADIQTKDYRIVPLQNVENLDKPNNPKRDSKMQFLLEKINKMNFEIEKIRKENKGVKKEILGILYKDRY